MVPFRRGNDISNFTVFQFCGCISRFEEEKEKTEKNDLLHEKMKVNQTPSCSYQHQAIFKSAKKFSQKDEP
jgi:hypothetical protein